MKSSLPTKSNPLLLTKTGTSAGLVDDNTGLTHTISEEDTNPADTSSVPKRHIKSLEKPKFVPEIVTEVPPDIGPTVGFIDKTFIPSVKVKALPFEVYSAPLRDISTLTSPCSDEGETHSICVEEIYRPCTSVSENLHFSILESTKL
jgi:hypothetical protein